MTDVADAYFPPPTDDVITEAIELLHRGWHPIPVPWNVKVPAVAGVTGYEGLDLDETGIKIKFREIRRPQLGARMPYGVIGIDIDQYEAKHGWDNLERFRFFDLDGNARADPLPPLPPTVRSTSRDWPSGIRFYLVAESIKFRANPVPDVELIQRHHRFTMTAPSVHPRTGEVYRWIGPDDEELEAAPRVEDGEIARLPWSWVEALRDDRPEVDSRPETSWENHAGYDVEHLHPQVRGVLDRITASPTGSRHDTMHAALSLLWRLDEEGRSGTRWAMDKLRDWFIDAVAADRDRDPERGRKIAAAEFDRSLHGTLAFIRTHGSRRRSYGDEVLSVLPGWPWDDDEPPPPIEPEQVQAMSEATDWPEPQPLHDVYEVPAFPLDVLPAWMQVWCEDQARSVQTPVDLPAMLALGVLATIGTRRITLQVGQTWVEPTNLYLAVGMDPSAGKSPVFKAAFAPIREFQRELRDRMSREMAEAEAKRKVLERRLREAEKGGDLIEIVQATVDLAEAEAEAPVLPQLIADDTTPEAFVGLLWRHGRIAVVSPEGGLFTSFNRYSQGKEPQIDPYLKAWSGDDITVNRKADPEPKIIEDALATICLTVQPGVLAEMGQRMDFSTRGLPQRFCYALPPSLVGSRRFIGAQDGDPRIQKIWHDRTLELARQTYDTSQSVRVVLDPEARRMFDEWREHLEARRRPNGDLADLAQWTTKCESAVLRASALLWLAEGGTAPAIVNPTLMGRALTLGRYWVRHAVAVAGIWEPDPSMEDAKAALRVIRNKGWEAFAPTDFIKHNWYRWRNREVVDAALELLVVRGWIRRSVHPSRPSYPYFVTNPAALRGEVPETPERFGEVPEEPEARKEVPEPPEGVSGGELPDKPEWSRKIHFETSLSLGTSPDSDLSVPGKPSGFSGGSPDGGSEPEQGPPLDPFQFFRRPNE